MTMPKKGKIRIDDLLIERGFAKDKHEATGLIMSGLVHGSHQRFTKPGVLVAGDIELHVKGKKPHPWVSRGGMKLDHGLTSFGIDVMDLVALDIGSSTGGFVDVLLHHGARKVYAVDVGYGELAWKLREDERVVVLERTNARLLTNKEIPETIDVLTCDASFIGLQTVLPPSFYFLKPGSVMIVLIKPQFEVERHEVGQKGVVTDPRLHQKVCDKITHWLEDTGYFELIGVTESPILGPEGNKEFLCAARLIKNLDKE